MLTTEKKLEFVMPAEDMDGYVEYASEKNAPSVTEKEYFMTDEVVSPNHYQLFPDTTVIDIIREVLTTEEFVGFCKGNSLKYRLRANKKGDGLTDIKKAEEYEKWARATIPAGDV